MYFVSETAQVELRSGRVSAPGARQSFSLNIMVYVLGGMGSMLAIVEKLQVFVAGGVQVLLLIH